MPPAFVAFDEDNGTCGALIEWFLNYPGQFEERRVLGGDIMTDMIPEFERSKGKLHNFAAVERYFKVLETGDKFLDNWLFNWSDLFLFDALIGNTDRHQDNWALLWRRQREPDEEKSRLAPIFDNGTSLGYEIIERKMDGFFAKDRMRSYIKKGRHHIRWRLHDEYPAQHIELLGSLVNKYPAMASRIKNKLKAFDMDSLKAIIVNSTKFEVRIPLTEKRAEFVCHLIESRYLAISERIEKILVNLIKHVPDPRRLLLAWQAPEGKSRARFVVGELCQHEGRVVFRYLSDTAEFKNACAEGFVCYPAFRKTNLEYTQNVLDTFLRRLPPRKRGDFGKYLEQWRLAPNVEISDFALLGHTGAKLPNDGFSLINPFDHIELPHEFYIEVAGFRHQPNTSVDDISVGMSASFTAEPENEFNSNAVRIEVAGKIIGYVSNPQCKAFNSWLGLYSISASIERINGTSDRPLVYIYGRVEQVQHCWAAA